MQLITSLCTHQFFYRSTGTGVLLRGGLITAIYSRALRLTSRARSTLTNGKLVNHISTDISRIDFAAGYFHFAWAAPLQMLVCLIILLTNLGPSALAGFGLFILLTPVQTRVMKELFKMRRKSMRWTDKRAKLLQELLGGIRIIKFFAWEVGLVFVRFLERNTDYKAHKVPFLKRIGEFRNKEVFYVRSILLSRAANNAVAFTLPVLYSLSSLPFQTILIIPYFEPGPSSSHIIRNILPLGPHPRTRSNLHITNTLPTPPSPSNVPP
jgi:ABC-type multidrug transport system fused ATPase/permease subunit